MHGLRSWMRTGLVGVLALGGCSGEASEEEPPQIPAAQAVAQTPDSIHTAQAVEQETPDLHEILERVDSLDRVLGTIPVLTPKERRELRQDVNAEQIARARALGVRASDTSAIKQLLRSGRLVTLEDSTRYWVLRRLEYSVPHVTPDTRAMLLELGQRFQAELEGRGLPAYRMEITSVLRTPETQAELRQSNANASREVSAHEFGTTLDIARAHFAAPAPSDIKKVIPEAPALPPEVQQTATAALDSVAEKHSSALQAALGRVLVKMREEGKLLVMMERRQAVYHTTVARRFRT